MYAQAVTFQNALTPQFYSWFFVRSLSHQMDGFSVVHFLVQIGRSENGVFGFLYRNLRRLLFIIPSSMQSFIYVSPKITILLIDSSYFLFCLFSIRCGSFALFLVIFPSSGACTEYYCVRKYSAPFVFLFRPHLTHLFGKYSSHPGSRSGCFHRSSSSTVHVNSPRSLIYIHS